MRTEINKKSDFDFVVLDSEGNAIDMPSNDFTLDIWTWGSKCRFRASSIGGVLKGCNNDGGKLRVYVDNPGFVPGKLVGEWVSYISSEEYPDGTQRTCRYISDFGIDMVDGDSQTNEVQVLAMMQYIQGASAYEIACEHGFEGTEQEWLDSVALPAVEAAAECKALIVEINDAEAQRVANEDVRIANEETRVQQESARATAEEQRTRAEANRQIVDNTRELAEEIRHNAEQNRDNAEAARASAENTRKTAEDARIANEATRQTNEQARVAAETLRESAETDRANAETARVEAEQARAEEFAGFTATLAAKEDVTNKVTTLDAGATDEQYPSAKAVWSAICDEENFNTLEEQFTSNRISYAVGTDGSVRKAASIPIDITPGCYIELSTNYFYGISYCFLKSVDSLRQGLSPDLSSYNTGSIHLDRPNVFKTYAPEDATILLIMVDDSSCKTTKLYLKSSRLDLQQIAIGKIDNRVVSLEKGMEYNIDNEVNAENIYSLSQENVVYNLLENITIDVSKCETLDGVKIIRIPSNSKLNMNGHYIHASNNVYLYNAGEAPCCIDFESNQKGMLNGVLLKGLFRFAKDVFLTNIATNYTQAAFADNLKTTLACIANSNIIWDVDNIVSSGTPEAGDTTLTNNSHIDGRGHTFNIAENLIIGEGCSIKNATIKSLYGGNVYMNDDSILDKCIVTKNKISIQGDRCSILNCTIEKYGIFVYGDYAVINKTRINCGSQAASSKPIFVTSSNNTITENFCNSGFAGIQLMFGGGKDRKCIENNYVARNHISGQAEEALAMDQAGNRYMNNGEFLGFADNTNATVLKIKFEEDLAELDDYVGFYIYGISDATIGYLAKITAVEDATDYTLVTVDRIMFDVLKESSESTPYYPFNEQSAIERGYKDYSNSMFAVGSVFVNNIFENNIIEKDSICLYGAGFYNSFINNRTMSNSAIALYMISNSKGKYMNKVKVLPICYNLVSGNTVLNGGIDSSYSNNFGDNDIVDKDERVTENYIAFNSFISNFCKTIYNEGFGCYIDTSLVVGKRNNSPYSYNNGIDSKNNIIGLGFIEESTNMNTILNSSTRRVIVKKEDGKFGIYAGNNEGAYKTVPIIEHIV